MRTHPPRAAKTQKQGFPVASGTHAPARAKKQAAKPTA